MENKYIYFKELPSVNEKTKYIYVINKKSDNPIGIISWYGAWRQYCFMPYDDTVFSSDCIDCINNLVKELNKKK